MAQATADPTAYISHWTDHDGQTVWQAIGPSGLPVCRETPDASHARAAYLALWKQSAKWDWQERSYVSPLPADPPVWDGDRGAFE